MTVSRCVTARAIRIASIVDSEPVLVKRHLGSCERLASSSATMTLSSTGSLNCWPCSTWSWIALTMAGCAWPWTIEPNPLR